jgi:predicted TIM-barrel fold metal-dependent hydrolase
MSLYQASRTVERIRARLNHPILDGDGHQLECMPMVMSILTELAGKDVADRLVASESTDWPRGTRPTPAGPRVRSFFGLLTENTLDRVTPTLPNLLYQRMEQLGFDYALLYPTFSLLIPAWPDDEVRVAAARAFNIYSAQVYDGFRDRLEPVAVIPMTTPAEAVAEIDYVVRELGLKAVMLSGPVPRTVVADGARTTIVDTLGLDSVYDYDPVWAKCRELRVAPVFHGSASGWGSRASSANYVYNHIGTFATAHEAVVRSLILGGVPRRFPDLRFSFLEGGVSWAAQLCVDLLAHYERRNRDVVVQYDPARLNLALARELVDEYAHGPLVVHGEAYLEELRTRVAGPPVEDFDDFAASRIAGPDDIIDIFSRQLFFGCEADDSLSSIAFQSRLLPHGLKLNALLASDIGHHDVPDFERVLPEAWEMVESGRMTEDDFRAFAGGNLARMMSEVNPAFFDGTAVEDSVGALVGGGSG